MDARGGGAVVVLVEVFAEGSARPVAGTPVVVQVRDTSRQDARATILGEARGMVTAGEGTRLAAVEVEARETRGEATVWAHVDSDQDGRVSRGDYVTVQSYPVARGAARAVRVVVKKV
jgi:hypothetical protein